MSDLEKIGGGIIDIYHGGGIDIPRPFAREIYLFDTYVAGTNHIENMAEIGPELKIDQRVNFFREVDNEYDKNAIVIELIDGRKIGYVPKKDNVVFARLMDAGKRLFGKVTATELKGEWWRVEIKIFLDE